MELKNNKNGNAVKETIQIEKLLSEYAPLMARIATTFEANKSLQDELIQEMSLAVWRAFEGASKGSDSGFRGEASVKTFVAKVAHKSSGVKSLPMTASSILLTQPAPAHLGMPRYKKMRWIF